MEIEEYAIKAMEALIRYGKMPVSNTKGVVDTAWKIAIRMKELEQQVKSVDLSDVEKLFNEFTTPVGINKCTSCGSIYCDGNICT